MPYEGFINGLIAPPKLRGEPPPAQGVPDPPGSPAAAAAGPCGTRGAPRGSPAAPGSGRRWLGAAPPISLGRGTMRRGGVRPLTMPPPGAPPQQPRAPPGPYRGARPRARPRPAAASPRGRGAGAACRARSCTGTSGSPRHPQTPAPAGTAAIGGWGGTPKLLGSPPFKIRCLGGGGCGTEVWCHKSPTAAPGGGGGGEQG